MNSFSANVIVMILLIALGFLVGVYVVNSNNSDSSVSTAYAVYPKETISLNTVTVPGNIIYIPRDSLVHDTISVSDIPAFTSSCYQMFSDSTGTDSVSVTYTYPSDMFSVSKYSHRRTIVVEKTKYTNNSKNVSVWTSLDPTWGVNSFNVSTGIGLTYKHAMFGIVGNSNKEFGIRVGFNY